MQGALVGFGTIAGGHLDAYLNTEVMDIKAVFDPLAERRKKAKLIAPRINTYSTLDDMFSREKLDFIDICSPPNTHHNYIRSGLSNNCHVMCEKPFLLFSEQYKGLLALTKSENKVVFPSHNYKFSPILRLIREIVHSEHFGQIISGHFRTFRSGHAVGVPEWNPHWRRDLNISGGGILRDHGTHSIYIACEMCRQIPTAVSCIMGNLKADQYKDTEDTVLMTLYFDHNIHFIINLSWAAGYRNTYYSIMGSNENIIVENDNLIYTKKEGEIIRKSISSEFDDPSHKSWFKGIFCDFKDVVEHQNRQLPLLKEALITTLVIECAYLSAKQGGKLINVPSMFEQLT
ncbi:MAG: hypothetical protein QG657_3719 [Acidobacteriota bacterium]|nr:hypothetical protein [Acidobacteriota bacterium]